MKRAPPLPVPTDTPGYSKDDERRHRMNEDQIQEATTRREQQEAALLRPDGSRYYSDEEHKERVRAIRREHAAAFDRIDADIEERAERAQGELEALENADPAAGSRPTSSNAPAP